MCSMHSFQTRPTEITNKALRFTYCCSSSEIHGGIRARSGFLCNSKRSASGSWARRRGKMLILDVELYESRRKSLR